MNNKNRGYDLLKRGIDIIGAGVGLVILFPVYTVTATLVKLKLGTPILFRQERPGKNGKIFKLYKFRSMKHIDEANGLIKDEDRLTAFGKTLRSTSLDELPSLINVLKGEMSLIGPRPLLVEYLIRYTPEQARRHDVRPGITGLAQVKGRNNLTWDQKFNYDIQYVKNRSLKLDISILWETVKTVFVREGISRNGHATTGNFQVK